jgi:hypothetical protein
MQTIEIDFDVFKALTVRRPTETTTYNDVLRDLLGLGPRRSKTQPSTAGEVPWVAKGVSFPHGTEFRATYKGRTYAGRVENGSLVVDGKEFTSPSAAAMEITVSPVNGWTFWECRRPGETRWQALKDLRS